MENHDREGVQLLAPLRDLPTGDVRVDLAAAVARGRRRYWTLRALQSSAAAGVATAVVIGVVALVGGWSADTRPEPNASGTGPVSTPTVPAVLAGPPSSCEVTRLSGPSGSTWAYATAVDPTGRFIVGREYLAGGQPQAVLWDGGVPRSIPVPGDDPSPEAVNSSGVAVGLSLLDGTEVAWVYVDGAVKLLRGGNAATLVGETGRIVGYRHDGVAKVTLVWDTPESDPVDLAVPGPGWRASVNSIAPDGTVVGSVAPPNDDTGLRDEGYLWHPDGTATRLPLPSVPGRTVTGFAPYVLEPDSIVGIVAFETPDGHGDYRLVRVDRQTGIATEYPEAAHRVRPHGPFNQRGWYAGSVGIGPDTKPAVASPAGRLDLPVDPDLTEQAAIGISDDGSIIVGRGFEASENVYRVHALVWHCQ